LGSSDQGTQGILTINDFECHTLELPWRNNSRGTSCIPTGTYYVVWSYSPSRKKYLYELLNVNGRSDIQIHSGNFAGDTRKGWKSDVKGCILLGNEMGEIEGQLAILNSRVTVQAFEKLMNKQPFTLNVVDQNTRGTV
jgi:hypothetical protein